MRNDKEHYIFGKPVDTSVGKVRFLKYHEYIDHQEKMGLMSMNVLHIYYAYKNQFKREKDKEILESIEMVKEQSLYNLVLSNEDFFEAYVTIFEIVLSENKTDINSILKQIFQDEELFMSMRSLVLEMNMTIEEEVSPNPEIQKAIERSRRVKQKESPKQSISDMASSIFIATGKDYDEISNMTVLQFYASYFRLNQFKSYDTTSLFATVAEKVSIEAWNKHINLFERESDTIDKDKFIKQFKGMV
ncbi:hypothetical protein [Siminovitchia sp. 179-K 8D1 HS]|uniref:hypothetical protein n=1 Tax=Siminovitchia sp. 179-K 8D1 HS TaxID=3142385 RepID=UPI00399EFF33